jgi:hypothetical protein
VQTILENNPKKMIKHNRGDNINSQDGWGKMIKDEVVSQKDRQDDHFRKDIILSIKDP